jgi:signal transduction histidine kinase
MIGEDIDLVMVPGAELGAIKADPGQIEQVIMNLAVNARDAMPHGGKLTIETANITLDEHYARVHVPLQPGEYVMIAISDTGVGMDTETQTRIFEPFFTTKGPVERVSAFHSLASSNGAEAVWVHSEPGCAERPKIYLPRSTRQANHRSGGCVSPKPRWHKETIHR